MNDAGPNLPAPRFYKEDVLIPPVGPDDLRRVWSVKPPWTRDSRKEACSPGADVSAVVRRSQMIRTLTTLKLLTPWTHNEQLDEAVFRLAATFPLHEMRYRSYKIPGDEHYPFDPNAFVESLVKETGIAHVWEKVPTKVSEGGRCFVTSSLGYRVKVEYPGREARSKTRQLLWAIWTRFAGFDELLADPEEPNLRLAAILFDDFLIANTDLIQQVVAAFRKSEGVGIGLLMEVEQRAQRRI